MSTDDAIDAIVDGNFNRAEWKHQPAPSLTDRQKRYIAQVRDLFTDAHANMLSCTPISDYQRRAEESLEMAAMWAIKAITHQLADPE